MKRNFVKKFLTGSLLVGAMSQLALGINFDTPKKTFLPVEKIFSVEHGFDTTDTVEIAVQGTMPDSCHTLEKGTARVDEVNKKIYVNVGGYVRQNQICWMTITPFLEVIQVGHLKKGTYEIVSEKDPRVIGKLDVAKSTSHEPDDHLYAPVDTVELSSIQTENNNIAPFQELSLKGTYPFMLKGCMRVTDVKSYKTENDVLVVMPISRVLEEKDCKPEDADGSNRFVVKKKVRSLIGEKGLVHVRTLNGRAVNKFVDFSFGNFGLR